MEEFIKKELAESARLKGEMIEETVSSIADAAEVIITALKKGGKVILFGNGGSAADAQHIACELIGKFKKVRGALPAIALTTDTSVLTALSNDFGFDFSFSRQVEALANPNDVLVAISTSGMSSNIIEAVKVGKEKGCKSISLTGKTGYRLANLVDVPIYVPSNVTPRIQEAHITIGHIICALVEEAFS